MQALGDVLAGTLVLGLAGPAVALARSRLAVIDNKADGTAGMPLDLLVTSSSRVRITPVDPPGPEGFVGPARGSSAPDGDVLSFVCPRRAVLHSVSVDVATAAPFGLLWWTRRLRLPLANELLVGPRMGSPVPAPHQGDELPGDAAWRSPRDIGEPRGVRPYRPGDSRRWVHWPATAHSGELLVREMEGPTADPVAVTVTLPADDDAAEKVAEQALGTVVSLCERGLSVMLTTVEATGRRAATVADRRSASRRLARAVAGPEAGGDGSAIEVTAGGGHGATRR